jgi:hypothetical protein
MQAVREGLISKGKANQIITAQTLQSEISRGVRQPA